MGSNLQGFVTSVQSYVCGSCLLFRSEGWFTRFSRSNGWKLVGSFGLREGNDGALSLYPLSNIFNLFLCFHWLIDDDVGPRLSYVDGSSSGKDTIAEIYPRGIVDCQLDYDKWPSDQKKSRLYYLGLLGVM